MLSTVEVFSSTILHIFTLGDPTTFFGVKRSKKGARVHQKGTRLYGKRDVPRSETMGRRAPRFEILAPEGPLARGPEAQSHRTSGKKVPRRRAPALLVARSGGPQGPPCQVSGPWDISEKNPTCHLFEWVRPSGFVDTVRKGRIEPKLEYLSRGDPLGRAETSRDRTTLFRGQKVKKGSARPPKGYAFKWEAGRPPFGDDKS